MIRRHGLATSTCAVRFVCGWDRLNDRLRARTSLAHAGRVRVLRWRCAIVVTRGVVGLAGRGWRRPCSAVPAAWSLWGGDAATHCGSADGGKCTAAVSLEDVIPKAASCGTICG